MDLFQRSIEDPVKYLWWSFFAKIVNGFYYLRIFALRKSIKHVSVIRYCRNQWLFLEETKPYMKVPTQILKRWNTDNTLRILLMQYNINSSSVYQSIRIGKLPVLVVNVYAWLFYYVCTKPEHLILAETQAKLFFFTHSSLVNWEGLP